MITVIDPFGNQIQIDFQSGMTVNQVLEKAQVVLNRLDIVLMDQKRIIPRLLKQKCRIKIYFESSELSAAVNNNDSA